MIMLKLKIILQNTCENLKLFQKNRTYLLLLILYPCILIFLIVTGINSLRSLSIDNYMANAPEKMNNKILDKDPVKISSQIFIVNKAKRSITSKKVINPFTVTGIGKVKGIFKASIEDKKGNYYYVKQGDKFNGYRVKSITGNTVILVNKDGKQIKLLLSR